MTGDPLPGWNDTTPKRAILEFVSAVTDANCADFVPENDRIAVFDNDGTLATEMPVYTQLAFALARADDLGHPITLEALRAGGLGAAQELLALTHSGLNTDEFDAACQAWLATAKHPLFGHPYPAMIYQPMLELLTFLDNRGFSCWIFSGGGVDFIRSWAVTAYQLPPYRLIGSVGKLELRTTPAGPALVKGTDLQFMNDGPQKPVSIHQHVGQRPLLAAGNTDGDLPMLAWTATNPYRTLQLAIQHTDGEREYAYQKDPVLGAGTDRLLGAAATRRWTVVDMAADWSTIFPTQPPMESYDGD